jgi:hypothetical protein
MLGFNEGIRQFDEPGYLDIGPGMYRGETSQFGTTDPQSKVAASDGAATFNFNERQRCVCRGKCDGIPGSAARGGWTDPASSGVRYLARAYRVLPG